MTSAPELFVSTATPDGETVNHTHELVTGEVLSSDAAEVEQTTAAAVPAIDPSLDSGRSLADLEGVIEKSIEGQIQAGIALLEIQARDLYREQGFDSFAGYLQGRWGYLSAGYRLMDAAKVQLVLTDGGRNENATLPKNEGQAREIAPLVRKNPEVARQVWGELTSQYDAGQLTAQDIRHVVQAKLDEIRTSPTKIGHAGPRFNDADTEQMGNRDQTKRFASFYGDDTLIGAHIAPASADVIVMPVTNRRNLEARVSDLAETAVSRLRRGGSLLLIANPSLLPVIFAGVADLLTYKWTLIESLDVAVQDRDDRPTIVNGYRALVWFTKGKYVGEPVSDIVDESGIKVLLEVMTSEDSIIGATGLDNENIADVLYLLNAKRRVTLVSANKTFLAAMEHNAKAQNYLPSDAPSAAVVVETGEADDEEENDGEADNEEEERRARWARRE